LKPLLQHAGNCGIDRSVAQFGVGAASMAIHWEPFWEARIGPSTSSVFYGVAVEFRLLAPP
jgi:hypothetical protein